jgi:hypothetical protein
MQTRTGSGGAFVHSLGPLTARLAAVAVGLLVMSLLVVTGSRAAFNATTSNDTNNFAAGTVVLADDDAGSVMFNLTGMKPGDTATKCVNVTYTGSLAADVKLYGAVGGTGLATYLDTIVDIGTGAAGGASMDCTGFTPSSNLHNTTLEAFGTAHTNYGNGAGGFTGATNPTTRTYRFTVMLQDDNLAQGKTASTTFTWEAQNT